MARTGVLISDRQDAEQAVTLQDIAREANLSVSAVSKALADYPHVSDVTRRRVRRISERLNYKPRSRGRASPNGSDGGGRDLRRAVGLILFQADPASDNVTRWLSLLTHEAERRHLRIELCPLASGDIGGTRVQALRERVSHLGAILLFGCVPVPMIDTISRTGLPCMVLGDIENSSLSGELPCHLVGSDKLRMASLATQALIDAGHRRIGFFCASYPKGGWNDMWLAGYHLAMLRAGLEVDPSIHPVFQGGDRDEVGVTAADHMLSLEVPPTAYVVPTVRGAARFMDTLRERRQIELAYDQIVMGGRIEEQAAYGLCSYPIVAEDVEQMGAAAIDLLTRIVNESPPPLARVAVPHRTRHLDFGRSAAAVSDLIPSSDPSS